MDCLGLEEIFSFDITPFARPVTYKKGDLIFYEGESQEKIVYLQKGKTLCSESLDDGEHTLLDYAEAPCFFGELEFLGIRKETDAIRAETECTGYLIDAAACRNSILEDSRFLRLLCVVLSEKLYRSNRVLIQNTGYPLKKRLATYILKMEKDGVYNQRHTLTAAYLGVTYRHLLFVFKEFLEEGVLSKQGRLYFLQDRKGLEAYAAQ